MSEQGEKKSVEESRLASELRNRLSEEQRGLYYDVLSAEQIAAGKERKPQPTIKRKFEIVDAILTGEITSGSAEKKEDEETYEEPAWRRATDPDDYMEDEARKDPRRVEWVRNRLAQGKGLVVRPDEEEEKNS